MMKVLHYEKTDRYEQIIVEWGRIFRFQTTYRRYGNRIFKVKRNDNLIRVGIVTHIVISDMFATVE